MYKSVRLFLVNTRWFKYDRDCNRLVYTQIIPVIFEPPCMCVIKQFMGRRRSMRQLRCMKSVLQCLILLKEIALHRIPLSTYCQCLHTKTVLFPEIFKFLSLGISCYNLFLKLPFEISKGFMLLSLQLEEKLLAWKKVVMSYVKVNRPILEFSFVHQEETQKFSWCCRF